MSSQPETVLVARIVRELERRGCIVVKMHGSRYMPKGFPDLLVIRRDGVTSYVEVKLPGRTDGPAGNGLSALQLHWLWKLGEQGVVCGVADCVADAACVVFASRRI